MRLSTPWNLLFCSLAFCAFFSSCNKVSVSVPTETPQTLYAASIAQRLHGDFEVVVCIDPGQQPEGFSIHREGSRILVLGADGAGAIYGVNRLRDIEIEYGSLESVQNESQVPKMKMRGACVGLQKTTYLPGHKVYEYPYTPENFPWFYDKDLWIRYLDMLAAANMNSLYLWNGHPFASLVKLDDYPFAPEVDDATLALNQEMFDFLTTEANRRGIRIIQMFYNIIVSKPFAEHYGIETQDRHRPITPLVADYTRKSIAAFVERYPEVGFLVCLGEAMNTIEDDVLWMTETIIPGIKDGLAASGRSDTPPIILRSHDTDGPRVLEASLPLYANIYTMSKYNGESLTTYQPGGPWGETHRRLAAAAPLHIDNVHILANLEPWRWSSPGFIRKAVGAMHRVHHSGGLHLYPQASYWDWPYTADRLPNGDRMLQVDRDWMWYAAWGRYAWNDDRPDDALYWQRLWAERYGMDPHDAADILEALDQSGEIAPKLLRRFGITEGNRQTLLLGMKMAQLVNPYKFTIYPGFYESCGPDGEKLIEYAEEEWRGQDHDGELPVDVVVECSDHGEAAVRAIERARAKVTKNLAEFDRMADDIACYRDFANSFHFKVDAALEVLRYKWSKDIKHLHNAVPLLEKSDSCWAILANRTDRTYLYANSMQTSQRRIPVGGDNGNFKTWSEMLPVYEAELNNLKANIERLENPERFALASVANRVASPCDVVVEGFAFADFRKGTLLYQSPRKEFVDSVAPELAALRPLVLNRDSARIVGTSVDVSCKHDVYMYVGFFQDDDPKYARPPKLEVDAAGNDFGQAEPVISNAMNISGMPMVNVHAYKLPAGRNVIRLPKGIILVAGFSSERLDVRDAGLKGSGDEVDWLFQ